MLKRICDIIWAVKLGCVSILEQFESRHEHGLDYAQRNGRKAVCAVDLKWLKYKE